MSFIGSGYLGLLAPSLAGFSTFSPKLFYALATGFDELDLDLFLVEHRPEHGSHRLRAFSEQLADLSISIDRLPTMRAEIERRICGVRSRWWIFAVCGRYVGYRHLGGPAFLQRAWTRCDYSLALGAGVVPSSFSTASNGSGELATAFERAAL
jgi:hypothetical protein